MTFENVSLDVLEVSLHGEDELEDLRTIRILLDHGLELRREAFEPSDRILCFLSIVLAHTVVVVVGRGIVAPSSSKSSDDHRRMAEPLAAS